MKKIAPILLVFLGVAPTCLAQVSWTKSTYLSPRMGRTMVTLGPAGGLLLCGGSMPFESWVWDGATHTWTDLHVSNGPAWTLSHASLAYDQARNVVVLLGGRGSPVGGGFVNETWEWNGATWTQRSPATPGPYVEHSPATFDVARQRTIVVTPGTPGTQTWLWDGTNWQAQATTPAPSADTDYALAYDASRQRTVLFGGYNYSQGTSTLRTETWEWDGAAWSNRQPAVAPPGRQYGAMTFDAARNRIVLYGGRSGTTDLTDTWEWDGVVWQQVFTAHHPPSASANLQGGFPLLAFDHATMRCVLRQDADEPQSNSTWEYDGLDWTQVTFPTGPGRGAILAFDTVQNRLLAYDDALWEYDGLSWHELPRTIPWPAPRGVPSLCFDPQRGRLVLFGGTAGPQFFNDTWEWDGASWTQATTAIAPPPRYYAAATFDPVRGRMMLFGGGNTAKLYDLWSWDGSSWTSHGNWPGSQTSFDQFMGMAHDRRRDRLVIAAHYWTTPWRSDTWEWDGSIWAQRFPATPLTQSSSQCKFAYDERRGRVVAVERNVSASEWDGTTWTMRAPVGLPGGYGIAASSLAYDGSRGQVMAFGGILGQMYNYDVWTYAPVHPAAYDATGQGCAGSAGVPLLRAAAGELPWLGDVFHREVAPIPSGAPVLLLLGLQDAQWNNTALPLDLQSYGAPGCFLHVGPEVAVLMNTTGTTAGAAFQIPNQPFLLGLPLFDQCLVHDPGVNAAGAVLSNAARLLVGGR